MKMSVRTSRILAITLLVLSVALVVGCTASFIMNNRSQHTNVVDDQHVKMDSVFDGNNLRILGRDRQNVDEQTIESPTKVVDTLTKK